MSTRATEASRHSLARGSSLTTLPRVVAGREGVTGAAMPGSIGWTAWGRAKAPSRSATRASVAACRS